MISDLSISRIRAFINSERVYILMLSFILLVNALLIFAHKIPGINEGLVGKKILGIDLSLKKDSKLEPGFYSRIQWNKILEKDKHIRVFINVLGLGAVLIFCLGLFLDIRIIMAKVKKRAIFQIPVSHLKAKWGIWDIFRLTIIFIFLGYILHIIEANLFLSSSKNNLGAFISLFNTGIMDLLLLSFIVYFVKIKYRQGLATIGLKIKQAGRFISLAILSYVAFLPVLAFLLFVLILIATVFNYRPPHQPLFELFLKEQRIGVLVYSTIIVTVLGPIVEESFFRGFVYNAIKRRWGIFKAIALTAVVFAGLHGNIFGFFPILALGVLLAYIYERTGSLISSIAIHILHNTMMVAFLFFTRYLINLK